MILMTLFAALLLGCSDNSGIDTTTIALKANKTSIHADGKDAITFTVMDQDGKDVTAQSSITVDGHQSVAVDLQLKKRVDISPSLLIRMLTLTP